MQPKWYTRFLFFFNEREERGRERWLVSGCALISSGWERHILRWTWISTPLVTMCFFFYIASSKLIASSSSFYAICSNRGQTGVNPIKKGLLPEFWTLIYAINSFQFCHTLKLVLLFLCISMKMSISGCFASQSTFVMWYPHNTTIIFRGWLGECFTSMSVLRRRYQSRVVCL